MPKELLTTKNIYDKIFERDSDFKNYYEPADHGDKETQDKKKRKIIQESVQLAYYVLRDYNPLTKEERKVLFPKFTSLIGSDEVPFKKPNKYNINDKLWNKNEANLIYFFLGFGYKSEKTALYSSVIKIFQENKNSDIRKSNLCIKEQKEIGYKEIYQEIHQCLKDESNWLYEISDLENFPLNSVRIEGWEDKKDVSYPVLFDFQNNGTPFYVFEYSKYYSHPLVYLYDFLICNAFFPGLCYVECKYCDYEEYSTYADNIELGIKNGYIIFYDLLKHEKEYFKDLGE